MITRPLPDIKPQLIKYLLSILLILSKKLKMQNEPKCKMAQILLIPFITRTNINDLQAPQPKNEPKYPTVHINAKARSAGPGMTHRSQFIQFRQQAIASRLKK